MGVKGIIFTLDIGYWFTAKNMALLTAPYNNPEK